MAHRACPTTRWTTLGLCLMVGLGVAVVGAGTAAAVTLFDFPGRRVFEWALLLPLAMPAYVVAYAYTDFLQFSGPLQTCAAPGSLGVEGRVLSRGAQRGRCGWVFIFALYPYVYLLARTALGERAAHLMEAARLLGAPLSRRIRAVACRWPAPRWRLAWRWP
jgi:iron(III) transport system permease protein